MSSLPIVFLDDDPEVTEIVKDVFEETGLDLVVFNYGQKALDYLEDKVVSLVMTDLKMPGMDGFEFFQKLKETQNCDVPVVLVSGYIEKEQVSQAFNLGFTEIIEKPFEMEELIEQAKKLVGLES